MNKSFTILVMPFAWMIPVPSSRKRSSPSSATRTTIPCTQTWLKHILRLLSLYIHWSAAALTFDAHCDNWQAKNFFAGASRMDDCFCDISTAKWQKIQAVLKYSTYHFMLSHIWCIQLYIPQSQFPGNYFSLNEIVHPPVCSRFEGRVVKEVGVSTD